MSTPSTEKNIEISQRRKKSLKRPRLMDAAATMGLNELGPETPVVIYTRVSTPEQIEGYSLAAQESACREFAERRGWSIVDIYTDPGHSGKNDKRPGFRKMIADSQEKRYKVVLVHKLDRFSRNIDNTLKYFRILNNNDATIASVSETFDYTTAQGRLFFRMMAVFAQWYLENLSSEVVKSKVEMAKKGIHNGRLPFGYTKVDGKVVLVESEAEVIRNVFQLYASGNYTDREVAAMLKEMGFKTRRGRDWSKDTVREFMQNEFYYGKVAYREQLWPGQHEPIITKELFEQCQAVRQSHAKRPKSYSPVVSKTYILQRIICCEKCERPLRVQTVRSDRKIKEIDREYGYYQEVSQMRGLACPHAGKSVRMDIPNAQIMALLRNIRLPADWQEEIQRMVTDADVTHKIETRRTQIDNEIRRLGRAYADGSFSDAEYEKRRDRLLSERETLIIPDNAVALDFGLQLESLSEFLEEATIEEQAQICHFLLESVYFDLDTKEVIRLRPAKDFTFLFRMAAEEMEWDEKAPGVFTLRRR
ncbi:MAG: recombinase family protein [Chloroflexota bacterium]